MDGETDQGGSSTFLSSDRLASLSDTMFGVAMTLIVTTLLPSIQASKGSALTLLRELHGELTAVVFSFAISGIYWISQQQRLAKTASVTPQQTVLHLVFLFLIVLVPISTSLSGTFGADTELTPVVIFGTHITLLAIVNLLLWVDVHRNVAVHPQIVRSSLVLSLFVTGMAVGAVWPDLAQYFWLLSFAVPLLRSSVTRYIYGS
ncbi:MAG: DUF1211 domain-containing protein [Acetobacteraceae bacterium]|nr:DUF1211 domain-containing protein [Acetobacteraceae bacterium]